MFLSNLVAWIRVKTKYSAVRVLRNHRAMTFFDAVESDAGWEAFCNAKK